LSKASILIPVIVLLTLPPLAIAQQTMFACKADAEKFCAQVNGADGQRLDCLIDHQKEISDACYDALKTHLDSTPRTKACRSDARQFCRGIEPGGGRIVNCLVDHQKELSDACYEFLKAKRNPTKS
jgi:hypothetical protein